jgi:hypothetical protein
MLKFMHVNDALEFRQTKCHCWTADSHSSSVVLHWKFWCTTNYHLEEIWITECRWMKSWEIKKEVQIVGKGHNVIFEIAILMMHTSAAKNDTDGHVPGNGGTCQLNSSQNWPMPQELWPFLCTISPFHHFTISPFHHFTDSGGKS